MEQQQLAAFAQQSMMGGALSAALANEGMMEKVGGGIGSIGRSFIGLNRGFIWKEITDTYQTH